MQGRIRVLWLIKGLGIGGAERLLADAIPYLDRRTFEYEVGFLLSHRDVLASQFREAGIPVFCLGDTRPNAVNVVPRLVRHLKDRRVDVLHSHLPYTGILGRVAGRLAGVTALVYTEHSFLEFYHPLTALLDRLTLPMDDATIAVSNMVRRSVSSWPVLRPRSLVTIYNGIAIDGRRDGAASPQAVKESLGIPHDHFILGNVAHIRPEKGHVYLIQALAKVIRSVPNVSCVFVGPEKFPGTLAALERYSEELGVRSHIAFTGFRADARELMQAFDIFVLPSTYEGLPVSLLEAMALGKPVIASSAGGIPEVVDDGVDGFLVEPRDSDALAERILLLIEREELRRAFSERAPGKVQERFSVRRMVEEVERLYLSVLRGKGVPLPSPGVEPEAAPAQDGRKRR